ncbi:MAG: F0F1 ATP synthase subunit alpha [Planctomycetota bacterium]
MKFKSDEFTSIIKQEIEQFQVELDVSDVGSVLEVGDGIAKIYGLKNASAGEMLEFENGVVGQVFNLEEGFIGAIILGDYRDLKEGFKVRGTGRTLDVPVGSEIIGRVIDPVCRPMDGKGPITTNTRRKVEIVAPGIAERQPVKESLQTGIKAIDAMVPIGRGQRELIIGDRKTGKTAIALDTIINQKGGDVICVYVAIGQKESTIAGIVETLRKHGAMDYTIVVAAGASTAAPLQYIAPYTGCTIAEHFMHQGKHTLCIYDDLSKHAVAYRQMSLVMRRPPGREAYPGDVFYLHSRLLERAVKLSDANGGGSLTALPIIETQEGEVSAYIPTNVISITDGQIYLVPDLFFAGTRPAIDVGISVSRVGGNAQIKAMKDKEVAGGLRLSLASYREFEAFARLGTELDKSTQRILDRGRIMVEVLKQPQYKPYPVEDQVLIIYAANKGFIDGVPQNKIADFEEKMLHHIRTTHSELKEAIRTKKELTAELKSKLNVVLKDFSDSYLKQKPADVR